MDNNKYEILAPCGSPETVYAAVCSGCDSIYIGAGSYNARAYAESLDADTLKSLIDYCHLRGVKVYITFNILYKQKETQEVLKLASELYALGADAFITADTGIFNVFKRYFVGIGVNASTQMCVHNSDQALYVKSLGADRIILARELSTEDIKAVYKALGDTPDIEAFVHGALCVCYSGRCLYSSFAGGRSGNRGRCAQPCRMEYTLLKNGSPAAKGALLSPKDIMTAEHMGELIEAGVRAFKIEGRMKGVPYVVQTVKTYKKALTAALSGKSADLSEDERKALTQVFSRGGSHSEGYLYASKGKVMMTDNVKNTGREIGVVTATAKNGCYIRFFEELVCGDGIEISGRDTGANISKNIEKSSTVFFRLNGQKGDKVFLSMDKRLTDHLTREGSRTNRCRRVKAYFRAVLGEPMSLRLAADDTEVSAEGAVPQIAKNLPASEEDIIQRLSKTGNTPFEFIIEDIDADKNIYIPVSELNSLRRDACDMLERAIIKGCERPLPKLPKPYTLQKAAKKPALYAEVTTEPQLRACLSSDSIKRIYVNGFELTRKALEENKYGKEIFCALPKIIREHSLQRALQSMRELEETSLSGFLTRNFTTYSTDKKIICDHTMGVFNTFTIERLIEDYDGVTLSPELTLWELKPLCGKDTEVIAYGKLPLMLTEQCPVGNFLGKNKGKRFCSLRGNHDSFALKDRAGKLCSINTHCEECFAEIQSWEPICITELGSLSPEAFRLIFTDEDERETEEIISGFYDILKEKETPDFIKNMKKRGRTPKGVL